MAKRLGLDPSMNYVLEDFRTSYYSNKSPRPTSYYTPPETESPRYTYSYKNKAVKKKTSEKKSYTKSATANVVDGKDKYPAIQIYLAWRQNRTGGEKTKKNSKIPDAAIHIIDARRCRDSSGNIKGPEDIPLPSQLPGDTKLVLFVKRVDENGEELQLF